MATIDVGSGRGDKKSVDSTIPLVPFIDLLLCCVMFLLVTAVWNQLGSLDAAQQVPGENTADTPPPDRIHLMLSVDATGYVLASTAGDRFAIPKLGDEYDYEGLRARLAAYHDADPARHELTLIADDGVAYQSIVLTMDSAAAQGFLAFSFSDS